MKKQAIQNVVLALLMVITCALELTAQENVYIIGESSVIPGNTYTYTVSTDMDLSVTQWDWIVYSGGTIISTSTNEDGLPMVKIIWDESPFTTGYLTIEGDAQNDEHYGYYEFSVYLSGTTNPSGSNQNFVKTSLMKNAGVDISTASSYSGTPNAIENITYIDGIGRPIQQVAVQAGGNAYDIITPIVYDVYGRQTKNYLPYTVSFTNNGSIRTNPIQEVHDFYITDKYENTVNPYSESILENSSVGRVLKQVAPGNDWAEISYQNDHSIKFDYKNNASDDAVKLYNVNFIGGDTEKPQLIDAGLYTHAELYKTITKDENWVSTQNFINDHTTEEFKNKQGQVILKRTYNSGKQHNTYYIYDDFGNLTFVLPPKVNTYNAIDQQSIRGQSFSFDNIEDLFTGDVDDSNIEFNFNNNGNLEITIEAYGDEFEFTDGPIMDLDFWPYYFPNIEIGDLEFYSGDDAGFMGIYNGELRINSSGNTGYDEFYVDFTINLSDYQSGFTSPPINQTQLNDLAYQYKYDHRNRLIEKKIPGKAWEAIVYNKLDQPVLTQDQNLKAQNTWLFTKYDAFGRVTYTGLMSSSSSRDALQNAVNNETSLYETKTTASTTIDATLIYYDNVAYPKVNITEILTINYYDDYNFDSVNGNSEMAYGITPITNVKGLATASKVRVLNTDHWITSVNYYDEKARPIYTYSHNAYLNSTDKIKSQLSFDGRVFETTTTHSKTGNSTITTVDKFEYDHSGRLITHKQNINNAALDEVITSNTYDDLGQLVSKGVGGKTNQSRLQDIDYSYNIRGWLKTINNPTNMYNDGDLFSFGINYNKPNGPSTSTIYNKPLYNGNISHVMWKTDNVDSGLRHYSYDYDALNRFTRAYYAENNKYNRKFNSYVYDYDRNGNIGRVLRLMQNPSNTNYSTGMDNLTYTYDSGNKLMSVKDYYGISANGIEGFKDGNTVGYDYAYDANGNMIQDLNKGIGSIDYNHLNLPTKITMLNSWGSTQTESYIDYTYDATGVKLEKIVTQDTGVYILITGTAYAGNYIYKKAYGGKETNPDYNYNLKFFSHPEGYIQPTDDTSNPFDYVYQFKDHLGNIRLSYSDNNDDGQIQAASEIIEENNYYPFGLKHKGYNNNPIGPDHKYGFGGKEEQDELGLGWIDVTARNYNPELGRWMNLDPLAEKMRRHSPYNFSFNNPIFFQDYDGMMPSGPGDPRNVKVVSKKGKVLSPKRRNKSAMQVSSFRNNTASSVTTSNMNDSKLNGPVNDLVRKASGVKENYVSATREQMTQVGQFFDSDGNKVSASDNASGSFVLTTTTVNQTIDLNEVTLDSEVTTTTTTTTDTYSVYAGGGYSEEQPNGSIHAIFEEDSTTVSSSETATLKESGNEFFGAVKSSIEQNAANNRSNRDKLAKTMKKLADMGEEIGKNLGNE